MNCARARMIGQELCGSCIDVLHLMPCPDFVDVAIAYGYKVLRDVHSVVALHSLYVHIR